MWGTLLLLLLLLPPTLLSSTQAEPPQERVPLLRLTQLGPSGACNSNTTDSPCEGLSAVGTTALTLTNRSLERLPSCLPRALRSLDGSHNLLRALSPPELRHLSQLQVLTLRHNRIAALSWGPGWPAGLHTLDLSYNRLTALPRCAGPELPRLRALVLSGNPLQELQPRAFACFPALQLLNLSSTALGRGTQEDITEAAFTGAGGAPLATLEVLDLSGTFLERIESRWIRDLPKLTSLYLRKMPRLSILEGDIFKMTPNLQQLDCQDSSALTSVHTSIFQDTPQLQVLLFQNCNLSSFPPWTRDSSQALSIYLFGNPLTCSCELSWLFKDAKTTVLHRAADTVCTPAVGSSSPFSAPLALAELPSACQSKESSTLLASNPHSFDHSISTPSTQGPSTHRGAAPPTQPEVSQQSVSKASLFPVDPFTAAAWPPSSFREETVPSATSSTAGYNSSIAPRAAGTAQTELGKELTAGLVVEPNSSATSTSLVSKHSGPFLTSQTPTSSPHSHQRTQATPKTPHPSPSEGEIPIFLLDDYEEEGAVEEVAQSPQDVPCDYHPCKHLQTPCAELQKLLRCGCPGLSGEDIIPDPPRLQGVSEITDTSALVHWCAPNSVVHRYQIRYSAEGQPGNQSVVLDIYATARQHPLYQLSPGTTYHVCVLAANRAGLSQPQASSWTRGCTTFTTKPSFVLIFAGLGAAGGLLLVCTLVLSACLCRRGWRPRQQRYDTHLVAYQNPAFDYPPKHQTAK
ncbi:leucine-rich repeat neuronal protein 4 [Tupaia chinensis]|uniref:leucine-rich repeat neuronal protein 4 n=1 Tax=Tupaia chinensis TaxID=246437 RepID=UPI0003C91CCC|nr:leucine-rich repeat neuronal protein 4 [Tupaia chinensis]